MDNALLTKVSNYGLGLIADQIKNNVTRFVVIGSNTYNDVELLAALENNDLNGNLTYADLNARKWIGYEGIINQSYYDRDNFLTFEIRLPIEEELNIYIYGFALIDNSTTAKKIVSISRSPSIFNKVKHSTSLFSIKLTFGQEKLESQLRDYVHNSEFEEIKYSFLASGSKDSLIISSPDILRNINIGTRVTGKGIPNNTVVVGNQVTSENVGERELKLSNPLTEDITDTPIFIVNTVYKQEDFVTRAEFNNWQKNHNHNDIYYRINEIVSDSLKLGGKDSSSYTTIEELDKIKEIISGKVDAKGGILTGSLLSGLSKSTAFREDEFVPLFYINKLIKELKNYVDSDFNININKLIDNRVGNLNSLNTIDRKNLVFALNEVKRLIGNTSNLETGNNNLVISINALVDKLGFKERLLDFSNVVEAINTLNKKKVDVENTVFIKTPSITEELLVNDTVENNLVASIGSVRQIVNTIKKRFKVDLRDAPKEKVYPIVLNESGLNHITDTIIWNESNIDMLGSFRTFIVGAGSSNNLNSPYLSVKNTLIGSNRFVKRIETHTMSSTITIYLRGGTEYYFEMRGSDQNPIVVRDDSGYNLEGTLITVRPENYNPMEYLDTGEWIFNTETRVILDYKYNFIRSKDQNSFIGQICYFPTNKIKYPYLPMVGQMLSKEIDIKLYKVIGNSGDPEGIYNTATHFKNLDGRDMIPIGISQNPLLPAQIASCRCDFNSNILYSNQNLTNVFVGSRISSNVFPNDTLVTKVEQNKIYTSKKSLAQTDITLVTFMREAGSYNSDFILNNSRDNINDIGSKAGLLTLYPAIRAC